LVSHDRKMNKLGAPHERIYVVVKLSGLVSLFILATTKHIKDCCLLL